MMVEPTVQDLLKKAQNRYELVIATSKRARQIADGAEVKTDVKEESPVTLAANEIAEGKIRIIHKGEENTEKRNIISLAGDLAAGKGAVSEILIKDLNYGIYKNGEYARKLASDMGLDITSFNEYLTEHPEIDLQIEKSASEYAETHDNFIIDARLGWYAVPASFKVYLRVDIDVAAQRAFNDEKRKSTESFKTVEEQKEDLQKRFKMENERYWNLYHVRKDDMANYDLVIDTTDKTPEEVAEIIKTEYKKWLEN